MYCRQFFQQLRARFGKGNVDLSPVAVSMRSHNETLGLQTIDQPYSTMVLDLELFCQLAIGNVIAPGETFDGRACRCISEASIYISSLPSLMHLKKTQTLTVEKQLRLARHARPLIGCAMITTSSL